MINKSFLSRLPLATVLAMTVCLSSNQAIADEPQIATLALLLDASTTLDILADGKVIILGVDPHFVGSPQRGMHGAFPAPYGSQTLINRPATIVTQGQIYRRILWTFSGFPAPFNGVMKLDSSVTIDYIGRVDIVGNTIEEDEGGSLLMIILTGEVR